MFAAAAALATLAAEPAFAQAAAAAAAAIPDAITDENLLSDFNVRFLRAGPSRKRCAAAPSACRPNLARRALRARQVNFLGVKVDHRVIVEWVVIGQTIGFVGSLIGGWYAADRKKEVERLNTRLVAVNKQLREQARVTQAGVYSPDGVTAASSNGNGATGAKKAPNKNNALVADDSSPAAQEIIATLRSGKSALKARDGAGARKLFERALTLCRDPACGLETPWKAERKALRGLGAAAQLLKQYDLALGHMMQVLAISEKHGDTTGQADAIGVIADIHTEAGDLEKAGEWYDRYISAMQ